MAPRSGGLVDVPGLRVGHHTADQDGWLTGTTVVLAPPGGMVAGVDVRGGAPGTRETDLLSPTAAVERVHAIVLTGGSVFGLAAASGVAEMLAEHGVGLAVGTDPLFVVPVVPAAVIFDLARGGAFGHRPDAEFGRAAVADAWSTERELMLAEGVLGAGTGACTGQLKGGIGQAGTRLLDGSTVAAIVVSNATGNAFDPRTGELWAARLMEPKDGPNPVAPIPAERDRLRQHAAEVSARLASGLPGSAEAASVRHTTIGVVATDALLTKAQCSKLAAIAHDGLARAVNPVHTMFDGDLFFGVSTGDREAPDPGRFFAMLTAAADVVTRAMGRSILAAHSVRTEGGSWPSYLEMAPSALDVGDSESGVGGLESGVGGVESEGGGRGSVAATPGSVAQ